MPDIAVKANSVAKASSEQRGEGLQATVARAQLHLEHAGYAHEEEEEGYAPGFPGFAPTTQVYPAT